MDLIRVCFIQNKKKKNYKSFSIKKFRKDIVDILLQIFLIRQRFLEHRKNYNSFGLRSINFRENTVRFENYSRTVKEESENVLLKI